MTHNGHSNRAIREQKAGRSHGIHLLFQSGSLVARSLPLPSQLKALFKKPGKPLSRPSARFIPPNNPRGWCFTTGAGAEVAGVPISVTARFLCLADLDSGSTLAV